MRIPEGMSLVALPPSVSVFFTFSETITYLTVQQDTLAYNRGSRDDWDRFARVTGDSGWSWDSMEPYMIAVSPFLELHEAYS